MQTKQIDSILRFHPRPRSSIDRMTKMGEGAEGATTSLLRTMFIATRVRAGALFMGRVRTSFA